MKKIKRFFLFLLLIIITISAVFIYGGYEKYEKTVKLFPIEENVQKIQSAENYTYISEIPSIYTDAVVATEDRRFYLHNGFDLIGTARAFIVNFKNKELKEGGSTITQQLAKNMYFMKENSILRKIAETFLACELERRYTKDEIFELYMNIIYYGSGYYNIYDASMGYFNKKPCDMNDFEATLLAGIPNAPSVYSPKVNPELSLKRQEKVVKSLIDCNVIDEERADEILNTENKYKN